jgi:phosphinothricin acetyltransferase
VIIRDAEEADLPAILLIYNEVIAATTAVFSETPVTLENRRAWRAERLAQGFPVLVIEDGGEVAGFGGFGPFRSGDGYRLTVEHSVHVLADRRGRGLGRVLLEALIERALAAGKRDMIAGVEAGNADSIRMHERLGFERAALLPGVAEKWGRPLDLLLLRRRLSEGPVRP